MSVIDVSDLNLHSLITALWTNMKPACFFKNAGLQAPISVTPEQIDKELKSQRGNLDYLEGRAIKTNFNDLTKVETKWYNRDAEENAFEKIVASLRA